MGSGTGKELFLHPGLQACHAAFFFEEQAVKLMDRGCKEGTKVNGKKLLPFEAATLEAGHTIEFGASARKYVVDLDRRRTEEMLRRRAREDRQYL